jgi:hypothetical protein
VLRVSGERNGILRAASTRYLIAVLSTIALSLALAPAAQTAPPPSAQHDRNVIRFFLHHPKLAHTPNGERALWTVLAHLTEQLRSLQSARAWPAHHQLWLCIHSGEGAWDSDTGNGYYGGLQMTAGWLGYFPGTANQYTQLQQENYAEQGYKDSGYSRSWLGGQWPNTSPPCLQYA